MTSKKRHPVSLRSQDVKEGGSRLVHVKWFCPKFCLNPVVFKENCAETRFEPATPLSDFRMLLQMDVMLSKMEDILCPE